jgi:hypothetical protein
MDRTIELSRAAYIELMEALKPEERWSSQDDAGRYGQVIYVPSKDATDVTMLIVVAKKV